MLRHKGVSPVFLAIAMSGVFGVVLPASAQEESGGRWIEELNLRLIPRFGLLAPDDLFYDQFKNFSGDGYIEWTSAALGRAAYVGLGVEAEVEGSGFLVRAEVARSVDGWLTAGHGILIPRVFFQPPQVVNTWFDLRANITFLSLQAVLPTRLEYRGIEPYVLAGYAGKWYSFGDPSITNEVEAILPGNGFTHSLELGAGLTFTLFGLRWDAQMKDSINKYWAKTQNDFVFSGGIVWEVR